MKTNTINLFLAQSGGSPASGLIMMGLIFVIMWVLMIRPQQKKAKALRERQARLKKGDNVVTIGGMHAVVNAVSETTVSLRSAEGMYVKYDKTAIASVESKGVEKPEKADGKSE